MRRNSRKRGRRSMRKRRRFFRQRSDGRRMKQDGGMEQMPQEQPGITMAGSGSMETRMEFQSATISLRTDTS